MHRQSRHLQAFILVLLGRGSAHGGAIFTELSETLPFLKVDSAAVYRSLQRLEQAGEVVADWDTSQAGPARKIYRLTSAGWAKLDYWREEIENRIQALTFFLTAYEELNKPPSERTRKPAAEIRPDER
jgi:PadR family transcriptional regulator, regulatory protein PadR